MRELEATILAHFEASFIMTRMDYQTLADDFLPWLKEQIPLIQHMGVESLTFDDKSLSMTAQLAPNVNDKGTAFGGSIATVATLCGWTLITLHLRSLGRNDNVVIHTSSMEYKRPILSDFSAVTYLPDEETLTAFNAAMQHKGRAKMALSIDILEGGKLAFRMQGSYVAMQKT